MAGGFTLCEDYDAFAKYGTLACKESGEIAHVVSVDASSFFGHGPTSLQASSPFDALDRATSAWNQVGTRLQFTASASGQSAAPNIVPVRMNATPSVYHSFAKATCSKVDDGTCQRDPEATCEIVVYNANYSIDANGRRQAVRTDWVEVHPDPDLTQYSLSYVLLHELGHVAGIDDQYSEWTDHSVMAIGGAYGGQDWRTPDFPDCRVLWYIYGANTGSNYPSGYCGDPDY